MLIESVVKGGRVEVELVELDGGDDDDDDDDGEVEDEQKKHRRARH